MNKYSYEKLNDGFVNLYKQGIFIRCYEYSAIIISKITGYRVYTNIDKKIGFVYLELGFPKDKEDIIIKDLEKQGYNIRIVDKHGNIEETIGSNKIETNKEKLTEIKKGLIKFI